MNRKKIGQYILAALCFLAACHVTRDTRSAVSSMHTTFDIEGHRGCRGLMPENTWPAMKRALDLGVTTLEMDAVISADKQVLLSHEPWMGHEIATAPDAVIITAANERSFNIYQMPYSRVMQFDVGLKPHPRFPKQQKLAAYKPLLSTIIDSVLLYMKTAQRPFPQFNIETKSDPGGDGIFHPAPTEFTDLLMEVILQKGIQEHVIIQSFDFRTLQYLHTQYPDMKTAMLIEGTDKRSLTAQLTDLGFTPSVYSPAYELVTDQLVNNCHGMKMKVIPWTVNDKETITRLHQMGVDGVITDYPDLFSEKKQHISTSAH
ncbi:MAG: glycerophosphodiester phosphodiesterase [Sphingobacteriales bacterium]|nr:glycerophosphodiester phosphodiesterase [Sphingobacteriales bacterium]OJW30474.1 MAG: glycerophosphodiester phosphodiesterase [Sphingobacteriales bacterium 46-32]